LLFLIGCLQNCLLSVTAAEILPELGDSILNKDFVLDEAFLQELENVIALDSIDFLTYEFNYYSEILANEPRLDDYKLKRDKYFSEYSILYNNQDYKQALDSYKSYLSYKDSINSILNARNITDLNEQYKTLEKQKNIELLNQDNTLKNLSLERRKQIKWIILIISVSLFIFLITFLIFIRIKILKKRKLKREIEARTKAQNELIKIKRELENLVERRKKELITANRDLESEINLMEKMREKILRAERFKIVGEMTSGMINVIKKPVNLINLNVQTFQEKFINNNIEINEMAEILGKTSSKVNKTLQSLKELSSADKNELIKADVNEIIHNTLSLFKAKQTAKKISFATKLSAGLPKIKLDRVKLEGALINLILNSIDSIKDEGKIVITSRKYKQNVIVKLTDTGCGMCREKLENIFSLFYTTKETGCGLGLNIVQRYILAMNGNMEICSRPGIGTTIRLSFPLGISNEK
jgi:signal transduction histidine kinase